jgi:hypothetical protein
MGLSIGVAVRIDNPFEETEGRKSTDLTRFRDEFDPF